MVINLANEASRTSHEICVPCVVNDEKSRLTFAFLGEPHAGKSLIRQVAEICTMDDSNMHLFRETHFTLRDCLRAIGGISEFLEVEHRNLRLWSSSIFC